MKTTLTFILLLVVFVGNAQIGGNYSYDFLSIPLSPRATALGGSAIAINDDDIGLAVENPALYTKKTDSKILLQYINYISDLNFGSAHYSKNIDNIGSFSFGIQYFNGGSFIRTDEIGNRYGNFGTSETALNLSFCRSFDSLFSIGATLKPIFSKLDQYSSFGIVMDIGGQYTSKNRLFTAAFLFKNMGSQITTYIDEYYPVPFEIQVGVSTKLEHAPFRISVVAHNLETPKLTYNQSNYAEPYNVNQEYEEDDDAKLMQDIMSHMIFGIEFVPTKTFFIRVGYNYMRQQELMISNKPGAVGFSWGFGFRVKKLHFSYANAKYHLASSSNQISITTNLNDFFN